MDTDTGSSRQRGGSVEPATRAAAGQQAVQPRHDPAGTRFELRDPFAEVTYRGPSFQEMAAKADQLGATRFHAVAQDGSRTTVDKIDGAWNRAPVRADRAKPGDRDGSRGGARGTASDTTKLIQAVPQSTETIDAKIDAQAERTARIARLEAALFGRYVVKRVGLHVGDTAIGQTEYRYRGDTNRVAFTETAFRLATETNNPSVARSMVDVAEARGWNSVRVSGNEDFKRLVWLEASLRGVRTLGYEPQPADQEVLKKEREARAINRLEPAREATGEARPGNASAAATKQSARGGGRKAVLVALEAVLVAKGVPIKQREAVMIAAAENLTQRLRAGQVHKVKVFDKAGPSSRIAPVLARDHQRSQERAAPAR